MDQLLNYKNKTTHTEKEKRIITQCFIHWILILHLL